MGRQKNSATKRNVAFLVDILNKAKRYKHKDRLRHAKADEINGLSELTLNVLHNKPFGTKTLKLKKHHIDKLRPHQKTLSEVIKKKLSAKKRKAIFMSQRGGGMLRALSNVF